MRGRTEPKVENVKQPACPGLRRPRCLVEQIVRGLTTLCPPGMQEMRIAFFPAATTAFLVSGAIKLYPGQLPHFLVYFITCLSSNIKSSFLGIYWQLTSCSIGFSLVYIFLPDLCFSKSTKICAA